MATYQDGFLGPTRPTETLVVLVNDYDSQMDLEEAAAVKPGLTLPERLGACYLYQPRHINTATHQWVLPAESMVADLAVGGRLHSILHRFHRGVFVCTTPAFDVSYAAAMGHSVMRHLPRASPLQYNWTAGSFVDWRYLVNPRTIKLVAWHEEEPDRWRVVGHDTHQSPGKSLGWSTRSAPGTMADYLEELATERFDAVPYVVSPPHWDGRQWLAEFGHPRNRKLLAPLPSPM